jgi:hypothetical protein
MLKAEIWTGAVAATETAAKLRIFFGSINVLEGTEQVYVINYMGERDDLRRDIQTVCWLKPGDIRIVTQNHFMRGS